MTFFYTNDEFFTDQVFQSREDLMEWVQTIARDVGCVIVTKRSKKTNDYVSKVVLMCDRGGVYRGKDSSRDTWSKKTNCPFHLAGKYSRSNDVWTLMVICNIHNHQPAEHMEGHPYAQRLSENEAHLVEDLTKKNVKPRDILMILREQYPKNASTVKTVYNFRDKIRLIEQADRTPMQVLFLHLQGKGYIFQYQTNDISNELEELFFIPPISMEIWRAFPHVLLMDATYKTNKYNMPFFQIVGVTSTNLSFCIAFVFIHKEREYNFTWALNCLKLMMDEHVHPRVIVTDRDLALMQACQKVFPEAKRLLCRWHISQGLTRNCRQMIKSKQEWDYMNTKWNLLCESPTLTIYLERYAKLESILVNYPGVLRYLNHVWLDKYKEMFVSVWTDKFLNFKNHTTNRVESQHSNLKLRLGSSKCNLQTFVLHIDQIVQQQHIELKKTFEKSRIVVKHRQKHRNFQLLFGYVSTRALDLIMEELKRSNGLELHNENCGCQLRTSCGLPCACELAEYFNSGQYIKLESIDSFWRKLDLKPATNFEENDISCDEEIEMLKKHVNKQSKFGKTSILSKIKSLYDAATTSVVEPAVQKDTRGRPNLKTKAVKSNRVNASFRVPPSQDPLTRSFSNMSNLYDIDLNQEPGRHSSYVNSQTSYSKQRVNASFRVPPSQDPLTRTFSNMSNLDDIDLNQEPGRNSSQQWMPEFYNFQPNQPQEQARHSSFVSSQTFYPYQEIPETHNFRQTHYSHPLVPEIPSIFHPYIKQIQDVLGDGNCGFRAVAVSLGRNENDWPIIRYELLEELKAHWEEYSPIFEGDIDVMYNILNSQELGFAPSTHWMIMPDTSLLIASRYDVIVHLLTTSNNNTSTCFPIRSSPLDLQHPVIAIGHVFGNHYVSVELQGEYPMPPIMVLWHFHKQPCAAGWVTMYKSRLDKYPQQNSSHFDYEDLTSP